MEIKGNKFTVIIRKSNAKKHFFFEFLKDFLIEEKLGVCVSCLSHALLVFPKLDFFETYLRCRALNCMLGRASGERTVVMT